MGPTLRQGPLSPFPRVCECARRMIRGIKRSFVRTAAPLPAGSPELAVVIPIPQPVMRDIVNLQDDMFRSFECDAPEALPHITLKLGFAAVTAGLFGQWLDLLASSTGEFEVNLSGVGTFDEGIAFLKVEPNAALEALRQQVLSELRADHDIAPLPIELSGYRLHVTLASGMSRRELKRLLAVYERLPLAYQFKAKHFQLLSYTKSGWIVLKECALRSPIPAAT